MAPRRRQAAPSAGAAASSLASLPDALLERIIGLMPQRDRHRAALVNRRWHAAAHAPTTLRSCTVRFSSYLQLPSFTAWLLRHGRLLHSLISFSCYPPSNVAESYAWELAGCLTACAATAAGSLQQLSLHYYGGATALCVTSWCPALLPLKSLSLDAGWGGSLRINSDLAGLTALTRLSMHAGSVAVQPQAQLPPNVERLSLYDRDDTVLRQLSGLTRLSVLEIHGTCCAPDGYAVLTSLTQLASLGLKHNTHLPACLPQLTTLQELYLFEASQVSEPAVVAVNGALQHLTQLTSLCILDERERWAVPAALAGLSRLQRCCLRSPGISAANLPVTALPVGPWAASLCSLGVSAELLPRSLNVLSSATQLTRLAITGGEFKRLCEAAFWEWAQRHPSLQQLQIDVYEEEQLPGAILCHVCRLAQGRPDLKIATERCGVDSIFDEEFTIAA